MIKVQIFIAEVDSIPLAPSKTFSNIPVPDAGEILIFDKHAYKVIRREFVYRQPTMPGTPTETTVNLLVAAHPNADPE